MTREDFIKRIVESHPGNLAIYCYDGLPSEFNVSGKIEIVCRKHGLFKQRAFSHIGGFGCSQCSGLAPGTTESFIARAKSIHGDRYDYSESNYVNNRTKVNVICSEHGLFKQSPKVHLRGGGCSVCVGTAKLTTDLFKERSRAKHGERYDYSESVYTTSGDKIKIRCPRHGVFEQVAYDHYSGKGCYECSPNVKVTHEEFIKRSHLTHGDFYNYDNVVLNTVKEKIVIGCPTHGLFEQQAYDHYTGIGCAQCMVDNTRVGKDTFITRAHGIHSERYLYDFVNYRNVYTKVTITCRKHGNFEQLPSSHLFGYGCKRCSESKGERFIDDFLRGLGLNFVREHKLQGELYRYDFFLEDQGILIEFHGIQHYEPVSPFGGEEAFLKTVERDKAKVELASARGHELITVSYNDLNNGTLKDRLVACLSFINQIWLRFDGEVLVFKRTRDAAKFLNLAPTGLPSELKRIIEEHRPDVEVIL